jgi:predicted Rdx family selenoprotein
VAALIKQDAGVDSDLEPGGRGELSVWVDGRKVAEKTSRGFPGDTDVLQAVNAALKNVRRGGSSDPPARRD